MIYCLFLLILYSFILTKRRKDGKQSKGKYCFLNLVDGQSSLGFKLAFFPHAGTHGAVNKVMAVNKVDQMKQRTKADW